MNDQTYARVKIISRTLSPEEISNAVGIASDHSWRVGDLRGKTSIVETTNGWVVSSCLPKASLITEHLEHLMARIIPASGKIRALADNASVEVSCVIYSHEIPSLYFDKKIINAICELGAAFDIDFYLIESELAVR